jgi:hypothetical protein
MAPGGIYSSHELIRAGLPKVTACLACNRTSYLSLILVLETYLKLLLRKTPPLPI